jgi:hypothetical protein
MLPENAGKTDGVVLTLSARVPGAAEPTVLARHTIANSTPGPLQAVLLDGVACDSLQLQVSCNANTAFDMAALRQLAIVDTNGDVLVDLAGRIGAGEVTTGLAIGRRTDTDPATFASSGAACTAQDGVVYVHPGWNNALSYPCVIQVPVTLP